MIISVQVFSRSLYKYFNDISEQVFEWLFISVQVFSLFPYKYLKCIWNEN